MVKTSEQSGARCPGAFWEETLVRLSQEMPRAVRCIVGSGFPWRPWCGRGSHGAGATLILFVLLRKTQTHAHTHEHTHSHTLTPLSVSHTRPLSSSPRFSTLFKSRGPVSQTWIKPSPRLKPFQWRCSFHVFGFNPCLGELGLELQGGCG